MTVTLRKTVITRQNDCQQHNCLSLAVFRSGNEPVLPEARYSHSLFPPTTGRDEDHSRKLRSRALKGTSFLVRGKSDWIRAFLSAEYVAYNNSQIAQTAESLLRNGALYVNSFVLEETHMFLKIISEDIVDRPSGLKAGVMIGNSEVGMGSVSVEPFVFRKPCTNDLIVSQGKSFRHAHIHLTEYEMTRRMAEAVSEGFSVASSVLNAFLKTREEPIPDPMEAIRKIAEVRKFSQKLTDEVVSSYLIEPEANRFGVINAFTNAAQKLGPCSGSRWNDLPGRCWKLLYNSSLLFPANSGKQIRLPSDGSPLKYKSRYTLAAEPQKRPALMIYLSSSEEHISFPSKTEKSFQS